MKKIVIVITFLMNTFYSLSAQEEIKLTKQQMYEDFDEMVEIMKDCNAQLPIRKKVTNIDQLELMKNLRHQIPSVQNTYEFVSLLRKALGYMFDPHAQEAFQIYKNFDNLENIDLEGRKKLYLTCDKQSTEEPEYFMGQPIYVNGEYYLLGKYHLTDISSKDTVSIMNARIISYNNENFSEYVWKHIAEYNQTGTRWDNQRKKYYSTTCNIPCNGVLKLENNGKVINLNLNKKYSINLNQNPLFSGFSVCYETEKKKVFYFEKNNILYIYLNNMVDTNNSVSNRIKAIGQNKPIKKVIIDIRNNRGGSDLVWQNVLKSIVADSLLYDIQMAFRNTKKLKKYYSYPNSFTDIMQLKVQKFDWLSSEDFLITDFEPTYLVPDSNSLCYKGKIYILQNKNVFSAGHSLTTYASHIEQLVSIGEPTGYLAGFGLNPALFQLKNSKFTFRLETPIDVSNVKNISDVYQDSPEIIISFPFEEYFKKINYNVCDSVFEKYLTEQDYLFQKILEIN